MVGRQVVVIRGKGEQAWDGARGRRGTVLTVSGIPGHIPGTPDPQGRRWTSYFKAKGEAEPILAGARAAKLTRRAEDDSIRQIREAGDIRGACRASEGEKKRCERIIK